MKELIASRLAAAEERAQKLEEQVSVLTAELQAADSKSGFANVREQHESQLQAEMERAQKLEKERDAEQTAHDEIGTILLPLVETPDGTSVGAAKMAAEEIRNLRALLGEAREALQAIATGKTCSSYEYDSTPTAEEVAKSALARIGGER